MRSAEQGASVSGNTFLRAYLSQGIEEFAFADYVYFPDETASRIPTPYEHFVLMQDHSALPIWRPQALINCKYSDLTVREYQMLLELYRSVILEAHTALEIIEPQKLAIMPRKSRTISLFLI